MKKITLILFLLPILLFTQIKKTTKVGQTTKEELQMQVYDKDSLANAVVLYEHANVYIDEKNDYDFRTDYYFRVKLFTKDAFHRANIQIPLFKDEKIKNIKAITYNLEGGLVKKTFLLKDNIFSTQEGSWSEIRFTLPNIKEGSVIEYVYSVISPYSQLDDWNFQADIPKIRSEYDATILANYKYNARLVGFEELDKNNTSVKKDCIYVSGLGTGDCAEYSFGMNDIPAFREEDYMLSKKNYMSRLILDLISFEDTYGSVKRYTKTWKDADKTLKVILLDNQLTKKRFFKDKLPEEILSIDNELEKAKKVYKHLQNKLFWNGKYWTRGKLKIKKTYDEGSGSVDAINLILYNSLKAADIESYIVASSTRKNGLPTKLYPITKDFNYILVKAVIDGKSFFLDATNKNLAFGQIPFKCINGEGRVLDFKNGSYWEPLKTDKQSLTTVRTKLKFDDNQDLTGELEISKSGYYALSERELLNNKTDDEYLDDFESKNPNISVNDFEVESKNDLERPIKQKFDITIETDTDTDVLRINPFIYRKISSNPFKLEERKYDVDYGFSTIFSYVIALTIPETYEVFKVPENKSFSLPNSGGKFTLNVTQQDSTIIVHLKMYILRQVFSSEEYHYLKEFYNQAIKVQESTIQLKKTKKT